MVGVTLKVPMLPLTPLERRSFWHSSEEIDGVLFVAVSEYNAAGELIRKELARADLVRG